MTRCFLLMLAGSLLAACAYAAGPIVGEPKELQGAWVLESLQINGDAVAIDNLKVNSTPLAPRGFLQSRSTGRRCRPGNTGRTSWESKSSPPYRWR